MFSLIVSNKFEAPLKFVRNGNTPSVPLCEGFLRCELAGINDSRSAADKVTVTLIGIGNHFNIFFSCCVIIYSLILFLFILFKRFLNVFFVFIYCV